MAILSNEDWLRFLADAGGILGDSLDAESVLQAVAERAVPRLGDWCTIHLREGNGKLRRAAIASASGAQPPSMRGLQEPFAYRADAPHGLSKVLRTGETEFVPDVDDAELQRIALDPAHLATMGAHDIRSLMMLPLKARGRILGAIVFAISGGLRRYGEADRPWAAEAAQRIALSLDNARLHRETREQAEALRQRESQYRALNENVPVMVWMTDPRGRPLFFNRQCAEFAGRPVDPARADELPLLIHPEDRPAVLAARRTAMEREEPYYLEFRLQRADGEYRWHASRTAPMRDAEGRLEAWFGSGLDVHELRLAEERLARSEADMRAMFEYSGVGLGQAEPRTGRLLEANRRLCEITGYSREQLLAMSFLDYTHPEDRERDRKRMQALEGVEGEYWVSEKRCVRKDGTLRWLQVHVTWLPAAVGRDARLATAVHDITERKLAEQAARQAREKMMQSQRLEAIGRLAGGIAHDFNNLLTAINGYTDLLLPRFAGDTPVRAYLAEIRQAGEKAAALTQQMLAYGRRQMLDPRPTDPIQLTHRTGAMLARMLGEAITLEIRADDPPGAVLIDPAKLEQALVNLALNARDAMPRGGTLTLACGRLRLAEHQEAVEAIVPPGDYAALEVIDTGSGIEPAVQARIFEPFFTTKEVGQGTGLGLPMVLGLLKQSGGFIQVESAVGEGSRFRILLPLGHERAEPGPVAEAEGPRAAADRTVLVVEDEDAVRRYAAALLAKAGYRVLEAAGGEAALALLEGGAEVHLLLTDVVMPGMMGTRLAEEARRRRPGLQTVFMTGYSDQSVYEYGILLADDGLLKKPFSARALLQRVADALGSRPAAPAAATA
jgi:PAS domain S-box-containing protein